MLNKEKVAVGWASGTGDEGGGMGEGEGCLVDDLVGEVVEYSGLMVRVSVGRYNEGHAFTHIDETVDTT